MGIGVQHNPQIESELIVQEVSWAPETVRRGTKNLLSKVGHV
jgi:hypothetical protein